MTKIQELACMLGLTVGGLIAQLGSSPEEAQRIANDVLLTMYDMKVMKEKIEDARRLGEHTVQIRGYTISF